MKYVIFLAFLAYVWAAPGDPHTNFYLEADQKALGLILEIRSLLTEVDEKVAVESLQVHRASIAASIRSYLNTVPKESANPILQNFGGNIHREILTPLNASMKDKTLTVATLEKHCTEFLMLLLNVPFKYLETLRNGADSVTLAKLEDYSTDAVHGALERLTGLKSQLIQDAGGASGSAAGTSGS